MSPPATGENGGDAGTSPVTPRKGHTVPGTVKKSLTGSSKDAGKKASHNASLPALPAVSTERKIYLERIHELNSEYGNNAIATSKYTLVTFIPICIFEQFRRVANLFYLLISVLRCACVRVRSCVRACVSRV